MFDQIISNHGILAKRGDCTRILVTHQVHFLTEADWIVILKNGKIEKQGTPEDLLASGVSLEKFLEDASENDTGIQADGTNSYRSRKRTSSTSSQDLDGIQEEETEIEDEKKEVEDDQNVEQTSKGKVKGNVFMNYIKAGASSIFTMFVLFSLFILTQVLVSLSDYWVSFFTNQEEQRQYIDFQINNGSGVIEDLQKERDALVSTELCLYILGALVIGSFLLAIIRAINFYQITIKASQKLHDGMFDGIICTIMRFFDQNPPGRILNRFSKDMGSTDEYLPKAMLDATQIILMTFGSIIVCAIVNFYFLIPLAVLFVLFIFMRKIYLKTSKNVKRLESITKSFAFTHLAATLDGLSTIRAFHGAKEILIKEFDRSQNIHTGGWFMFISTSVAFGFALDLLCLAFVFVVTFSFLWLDFNMSADKVGLAISQAISMTAMLQVSSTLIPYPHTPVLRDDAEPVFNMTSI